MSPTHDDARAAGVHIGVFCGSTLADDHAQAVRSVGRALGERGITLVYGGGGVGAMGLLASSVLESGGHVIGVIPRLLMDKEHAHPGVTDMRIVESMLQRKELMMDLADAYVILPGGLGTLDELFEVMTANQLGQANAPIGLVDVDGYWDHLLAMLDRAVEAGYLKPESRAMLTIDTDPQGLVEQLLAQHQEHSKASQRIP